ncbi:hypothetical protein KP509_33G045300 [Ceratopteris richardii]|uniref:Long-chain-fatty-acid--CoA ligase n=1 Tax=Ceratopteris richardii TaxID=49495 RepID=A0A8T2QQY2_CERRI|nr:hypothetical protein KP509_33G045300 [Ceratopteris richardii]
MDTDLSAHRRLEVLDAHLRPLPTGEISGLSLQPTMGEFWIKDGYSVVLPEKLSDGKWNVYRSARSPLQLVERFSDYPDVRTLHDNFQNAINRFQDLKYLGTRIREDGSTAEYKWMTYGEVGAARAAIGSGLIQHGIGMGSCIGLYFINRPEWIITEHACSSYSFISVPLYDTLGPDAVKYIIGHAEMPCVFCTPDKLQTLLNCITENCSVRLVVVVGGNDLLVPLLPSKPGVQIVSFSRLEAQGRSNLKPFVPPQADDVATICYTSGTTGTPKGAVLSHGNLIANVAGSSLNYPIMPTDIYISYLPLAHIYERVNVLGMTAKGAALGFYQGDVMKLMDDMAVLRPTIFPSVPRLYNRIYDGITSAVRTSGGLKERLFNVAYKAKKQAIESGKTPSPLWDRLVFNKIQARLGGRVRMMFSGASPLSPDVLDFLRICFGGIITEGYGMTETACVISTCDIQDYTSGHVGAPNPACEVKLVDVPEMNYTSEDKSSPRGEICVRGPIIFKGYYKDEVQTKEIIDEEGWLHTGDIGAWLPGGRLKIIDRKKNIFKLAQGEYIAPEKIENVYSRSKYISQCFVYGDSFNSSLVAIAVVEPEEVSKWAKSRGSKYSNDLEQLCKDAEMRAVVLADMDSLGHEAKLRGFEFAKAVTLVPEPLTVESGLLTPTLKVKELLCSIFFNAYITSIFIAQILKFC